MEVKYPNIRVKLVGEDVMPLRLLAELLMQ